MNKEIRTICYDEELGVEAYRLEGIAKPFPNHFHDYYVIGCIEAGARALICRGREYTVGRGSVLLFNPYDSHGCVSLDGEALDYRGLNIPKEKMRILSREITGSSDLPFFSENVIEDDEIRGCIGSLHQLIMDGSDASERYDKLLLLVSLLTKKYGQRDADCVPEHSEEVLRTCEFMREHLDEHITLEQLCGCSGLSRSGLLRAFAKVKGITPYRYLQTIRIDRAKKLLEQGDSPVEAALRTGFSDQSHFTNFFKMFIGLSPAAYRRIFKEKDNG